jgi:hypothetical protein
MAGSVFEARFRKKIHAAANASAKAAGRHQSNIEDHIRIANELLRGSELLGGLREAAAIAYRRRARARQGQEFDCPRPNSTSKDILERPRSPEKQ